MWLDVYIGELSSAADPLDWGGDWNGNVPTLKVQCSRLMGSARCRKIRFPTP